MRCLACEGAGWIRSRVPSKLYDCGFFVVARMCRFCNGTKELVAGQMVCAAAGEKEEMHV
jgi:hypothetical protein